MEEKIRFEVEPKPEIEDIREVIADTEEFDEPNKAKAIIKNLNLNVGDSIRENEDYFVINPKMVLQGDSPNYYKKSIENLKKILTKEEIKDIDNYIKRKKEDEKVRDKIYYGIEKRIDKFYWRQNMKKSVSEDVKEVLEFFKADQSTGLNNTVYHLLSKGDSDFVFCYKCAWKNKPIPNIQKWREENDGEYRVLTDSEADQAIEDYFDDDYLWKQAVEAGQTTEGFEDWKESVINMDGRGSMLSSYDSCEEYEKIDGVDYYIYRTN